MPCRQPVRDPRAEVLPLHPKWYPPAGDRCCLSAAAVTFPHAVSLQKLSCELWPAATCSHALQAQHRQRSTGTSFSKGRLAHCSLILPCWRAVLLLHLWWEWPLPPDGEERKNNSCVAPQVIGHCPVARLLQESKEIQTQPGSLGWDRDTWTQLKAFSL